MSLALKRTSPRFWNFMAKRYSRSPVADEASYQRKLAVTREFMRPDMNVLEFGCGTGSTALVHAPCVASYLATDFSAAMIDIAREKAWSESLPNLNFEVAAIEDKAHPKGPFDMVLGLSILHLLPARQAVMQRVWDSLSPGGYFVSSTVCLGDMPWYVRAFLRTGRALRVLPYVSPVTGDNLRAELMSLGFEIVHDWRPAPDRALFLVAQKPQN